MAVPASSLDTLTLDDQIEAVSANLFFHFFDPQQRRGAQVMAAPKLPTTTLLAYTPGHVRAQELVYEIYGGWKNPTYAVLAQPSVVTLTERVRGFMPAHGTVVHGTFADESDGRLWHEARLYDRKGAMGNPARFTLRLNLFVADESRLELHILFTPPKPEDMNIAAPTPVYVRH